MGATLDMPGIPQACSLFHWQEMRGVERKPKSRPFVIPVVLLHVTVECVFHLNSDILMNGQPSCRPFGPEALILPTVHFLDELPSFRHLCVASLLWSCQRSVELSLWDSQLSACSMCPEAGLSPSLL